MPEMNVTYSASGFAEHSTLDSDHGPTGRELGQLWRLLMLERRDIGAVLVYAVLGGLLALVLPLGTQAVVNTVAFGVFTPNLWVLCALVLVGLLAGGSLFVMERYIVDLLQRRLFVRTTFDVAYRLPRIREGALADHYAPELVNRFFDVLTLQKTLGKVLLDGSSAALTVLFSLILLAAYHPIFLVFDVIVVLFLPFVVVVLGRGGLATSVAESTNKYAVANWLEEVARCRVSMKLAGTPPRQLVGSEVFRALLVVGALGIGGSLVIRQQLSLGQFVAAEVVVLYLAGALQKLVAQLEHVYDLLTALHKLGLITGMPLEREPARVVPAPASGPAGLHLRDVVFSYRARRPVLDGATAAIAPGERVSLIGRGKSSLVALVTRFHEPASGLIELDGIDVRTIDPEALRVQVGVVEGRRDQIFEGTLEENVTMGRPLPHADVRWAIATAQLADEIGALPEGLQTPLPATGANLSESVCTRILCARAIVGRPRLLIVDDALAGLPPELHRRLLDALWREPGWTLIDLSQDPRLGQRSGRRLELRAGRIIEPEAHGE
jgi:ABC-type bacteriocin/lantibiotic exporter with double-glycine peptidase domain